MKSLLAAAVLVAALEAPAAADIFGRTMYAITVAAQPDSPVKIEKSQSWVVGTTKAISTINYRNITTDKTITAVRFSFTAADAFNEKQTPVKTGDSTDTVTPGVLIADKNVFADYLPWPNSKAVTCAVERVHFQDGSNWPASPEPKATS